ncbi:hypothetical protein A1O3_00125, partial [Capronia epimyces CBS 606.96]
VHSRKHYDAYSESPRVQEHSKSTYQLKMERVYGTPLSKIRPGKEQPTEAVDEYITPHNLSFPSSIV